ncbi:signal recognition particle-docking protein FtsY [Corynebacterium ammoniagenes]|uniref:Signal recognition particle receptor FtsY n=1 Tax=Corynebacterium ammoniagenes DSM 20306 TaxID=649754 RepID=A0ABN0AIA9_CORAM|nr:signal recognition particle-docking protein FtsY [Corynebacterium ammoniagenes]APT82375.1 cell division protein FtsY [Corynebacterium ammoniagenes DSM 20306]AQS73459.1 signal recognition particle-docking protein FtsY [Corynebacterium ammoniagenes]EFG82583.1 signal recognition particle-docking protein FtsY [Corynebacterium ammoniagenes DSM 20306]
MESNLTLWIGIAVVVLIIVIVLLILWGKKRGEDKKVTFDKPEEEPKELTQQQKSGNYQAQSGFNFAPAKSAEPVPAREDKAPSTEHKKPQQAAAQAPEAPQPPVPPVVPPTPNEEPASAESATQEPDAVKPAPEKAAPVEEENPEADSVLPVEQPEEVGEKQEEPKDAVEESSAAPQQSVNPEEDSPIFDEVAEDLDAEDVRDEVDEHEKAQEAADAAEVQSDSAAAALEETPVPEEPVATPEPTELVEEIEPAGGRLGRLRGRLSRSQNAIGQGLMGILSAGDLDEDAWEEIEDTLIMADLGTTVTMKVSDSLRQKIAERGVSSEAEARAMLREALIEVGHPEMDRSIKAMPHEGKPAVIMVVGVNGTGKTTTTGKLARVLVSMGHSVLLGAADTFRAAAADQLETWGRRVGATTVRGKEGADPASVAFDAVAKGVEQQVDVVLVDTAGRLHTSNDLMDQLGKVKRVVEKKSSVDEVLLVIDATVGQNGLMQARVFREVVDITGVVLTKLDGTAKGGIVFQVQEELGVPVKLVGLGEGADHLAPFEVEGFVDALLGEQ